MSTMLDIKRSDLSRKILQVSNLALYAIVFPLLMVPAWLLYWTAKGLRYIPDLVMAQLMALRIEKLMEETITKGMGMTVDDVLGMKRDDLVEALKNIPHDKMMEILGIGKDKTKS